MEEYRYMSIDESEFIDDYYKGIKLYKLGELGKEGWKFVSVINGECIFKKKLEDESAFIKYTETLNETCRNRDQVKGALKEIKLRKVYEGYLKTIIENKLECEEVHSFEKYCELIEGDQMKKIKQDDELIQLLLEKPKYKYLEKEGYLEVSTEEFGNILVIDKDSLQPRKFNNEAEAYEYMCILKNGKL